MITYDMLVRYFGCPKIFIADYDCDAYRSCIDCCGHLITEYGDSIKSEAVYKFVEWLIEKGPFQSAKIETIEGEEYDNYGQFWLAKYEKEQKNEHESDKGGTKNGR